MLEPGELKILGERAGLRMRTPDGREGLVTWDEVAAYVRQPRQMALPCDTEKGQRWLALDYCGFIES